MLLLHVDLAVLILSVCTPVIMGDDVDVVD